MFSQLPYFLSFICSIVKLVFKKIELIRHVSNNWFGANKLYGSSCLVCIDEF